MEALVLWEVSRKQDYIFASNKLKENRGASIIIENITEELPLNINLDCRNNIVYNGGGSSIYKFESRIEAKEFIKIISERILIAYPGVEVFMVIEDYDEDNHKVTEVIDNAYKKLAIKKNRRINSGLQTSFGIERICSSTGLPASQEYIDDGNERRYRSEEIAVKIENSEESSSKFDSLLPDDNKSIRNFNELSKGNKNYLAVVHIDGNGMGKKFNQLKSYFEYIEGEYSKTNRKYLESLKNFSDNIKKAYENSFKEMTKIVKKNAERLKKYTCIEEGKFPVIPIIVAGDDVTYVTNGKIGIETARIFIEHLCENDIEIYNGEKIKLNACAGIAIVKTSHPFAKAYELAENLCSNAKKRLRSNYLNDDNDFSLLDWHIEQGDLMGTIQEIRDEHYKTLDNKVLYMRPLYLNNEESWTTYKNFKTAFYNITEREIHGRKIARNKLKELREILKKGESDTEIFLKSNKIQNYFSRFDYTAGENCFHENTCMYFDAIESMDLYIELGKEGDKIE